jgi:ubiquinone/menaquinone biosynthesis C-methylase UbiE
MSASPEGIAGVFDRAAPTYDAVGVPWFGPIAEGLLAELDAQPGERALDIGCGRGAVTRPLAEAVGPTGHVLGVDLAPAMVALTAADLAHLPQVTVQVADASALDVAAGWDLVASSLVLFFLPDPAAALTSWVSLLRPGGRLGISTFGAQDPRWKAVDDVFSPYLPQGMRDARTSGARGPFASDEGVEALLTGAGLKDVRTAHREVSVTFTDPEQWYAFSWSHGQRAMWECVPDDQREAVKRECLALVDGWTWTQQVRYTLGVSR